MSILLERKHVLLGAISSSENIRQWCLNNSINYFESISDFESIKPNAALELDVIFSIVNECILPDYLIEYPKIGAINYHNSPLPKYAGLYATSWAILNNEKEHAVTWHWMQSTIDTGDILKQPRFLIDDNETALTLNLKCYEHAVHSFSELIDELSTQSESSIQQDLSFRTYFGLKNKPKHLGFLSFDDSAEEIERICRALYLGNYRNELASPKIKIMNQYFIVNLCKKLTEKSDFPPGTVVCLEDNSIQVTTSTTDILFLELVDLHGNKFSGANADFLTGHLSHQNDILMFDRLMKHQICLQPKYEKFWINQYKQCIQNNVSFLSHLTQSDTECVMMEIQLSNELIIQLSDFSVKLDIQQKYVVLAVLLMYWYRLNNYNNYSIAYSPLKIKQESMGNDFLSKEIPLTTLFKDEMSLNEVLSWILTENKRLSENSTYMLDIFIRYPEIKSSFHSIELAVGFFDVLEELAQTKEHKICVNISERGDRLVVCNQTNYKIQTNSFAFLEKFDLHLSNFMKNAIDSPDRPLYEIKFLAQDEINCLLNRWNKTDFYYDRSKLLHHYLEDQVVKNPDSTAAIFGKISISYAELNRKSNIVANYLIRNQVKANDVIGVFLNRGLELIISILGILKAGAAYLPLDPNYPKKRIEYMLQHSQSRIMLTEHNVNKKKPNDYAGTIINLSNILNSEFSSYESPLVHVNHEDLAYVIYTSGTTGTPKGVAITHRSACNHMVWMSHAYDFNDRDVFLLKTPCSFDASVWEIFIPLFIGAKMVIAPEDAHTSPDMLIQLIQSHQVNIIQLVPSMLRELILSSGYIDCISLRHVFCGGEVLLQETIHSFMKHNHFGALLHNLYGPTECTIDAITLTCSSTDVSSVVSRIGRPIYNTQLFVLDNRMQLVPVGILGELYISGDGLAKGYLNELNLTKQKFLKNSIKQIDGELFYKTGDLVKWQSDGIIEYHGRDDTQIKIRGFRIEVSEIESCLEKHPSICQCLVKSEPSHTGAMALSAYITITDENITASDIRDILKKDMPDYMIPTRYFVVDKLLFTPSGKLDRKAKLLTIRQLYFSQEHILPSTDTEMVLHRIWCEILQQKSLGINDDFFELGGQSLLAMQMITRIKKEFLVRITIRAIFDYPTIYSLSKEIEQLMKRDFDCSSSCAHFENIVIPIKRSGHCNPLFLVHPVGGSVFWYTLLGQYLDRDVPLYGVQDPGIEANALIFDSIEQMAHTYIDAIRTVQPSGPYVLGGASFGSTVAVEMARQLSEKGEEIKAVISLDGWAVYPALQSNESYFRDKMRIQNAEMINKYMKHHVPDADFLLALQWHREKLLTEYQLPMINSQFILFKAETLNEMFDFEAPMNWWDEYVQQTITIKCHVVSGDHETMFTEPHVKKLAKEINQYLKAKDSHEHERKK